MKARSVFASMETSFREIFQVRTQRYLGIGMLLCAFFALPLKAQMQSNRFSTSLTASSYKYWGEFTGDLFGYGADVGLRYDVAPWAGLQLGTGIGVASFRVTPYDLVNYSNYYEGQSIGQFYKGSLTRIDNINTIRFFHMEAMGVFHLFPSNDFVPQAYLGMGMLNHYATNSSDHSPLPRILNYRYSRWSLEFPVGLGFEYFVNEDFSVNARAMFHLTTSDNLDDFSRSGSANDYYASAGAGVSIYLSGNLDTDGDGVSNKEERHRGLDSRHADTDGDSLSDFQELMTYRTDPLRADSDSDGLFDGEEIVFGSSPLKVDTDGDGLTDLAEYVRKSNARDTDSDDDGILDGDEVHRYNTSPTEADTDRDGLNDIDEQRYACDPKNPDTDGDGLRDGPEVIEHRTSPIKADTDGDGLSDAEEIQTSATDPHNPDTDNDGLLDGDEVLRYKSNPKAPDTDFDGWSDGEEVLRRCTNPVNPDTDGDGTIDSKDPEPCGTGCCCCNKSAPTQKPQEPLKQPKPKRNFSIKFLRNSDIIDANDAETQRSLRELQDYLMSECDKARVTFEGHTSSEGNADRNRLLSEMRARSVKQLMIDKGVAAQKIQSTVGFGSALPLIPEPSASMARRMSRAELENLRKQNRRISVREDVSCD